MKTEECLQRIGDDLWFTEIDRSNLKIDYRIKEVVYRENSPLKEIMVLDSYDFGRILVLDDAIQTTSGDGYIYNEMISHVPLNIHPSPKNVLIIGGGDCGVAREVSKYSNVERIDMVEIDEMVVQTSLKYLPEVSGGKPDPRINFIFHDGTCYVKEKRDYLYDVIIIDSSDPVGPAVKLFELGFYKDVYDNLCKDGLMVCQSESPIFYTEIFTKIYKNLSSLFPIVKPYMATVPTYPGGFWTFTIGSKKYSDVNPGKFDKETKYVNREIIESCFALPNFVKEELGITN